MKNHSAKIIIVLCVALTASSLKGQDSWLQFRGPGSSGIAQGNSATPVIPDPQKNLTWKVRLASGHSSPIVANNRAFLTGYDESDRTLVTYCINLTDGNILWQRKIQPDTLETFHQVGNPAESTPVTDGKAVYVYFGSHGVLCYDMSGKLIWEKKLPLVTSMYGSASSPVLAKNLVIVSRHDMKDPTVLALDKNTGKKVWEYHIAFPEGAPSERSNSNATPVIWKDQVIIHSHFQILSINVADGKMNWSYQLVSLGVSTPVIVNDIMYVNGYLNLGEGGLYDLIPPFAEMINRYDGNKDNLISFDEIPEKLAFQRRPEIKGINVYEGDTLFPVRLAAGWFDADKNKKLSSSEWTEIYNLQQVYLKEHGTLALKLSQDKVSKPELLWKVADKIPEVPSLLVANGHVYMICDGGILTCIDSGTGKIIYRDRLKGNSLYLSSPVYANGHIYCTSYNGVLSVISPADELSIKATVKVGTHIGASPAVAGNTMLIRDENTLMAFRAL